MGIVKKIFGIVGAEKLADQLFHSWIKMKEKIQYSCIYPIVIHIPFFQNIYFLFSKSFAHEKKMFLMARRQYLKSKYTKTQNLFLLRRNIHRIEKGLLMKERRSVFALDYIQETVDMLACVFKEQGNDAQIQWAFDVLNEYFSVTDSVPVILKAKEVFKLLVQPTLAAEPFVPYQNFADRKNYFETFKALAHQRKSIRYFDKNNIPERTKVDEAVVLAGLAPSSCNRQPFQFRIVDEPALLKKLVDLPGGTRGFANQIAAMIVVVGQMNVSPTLADRHLMYVDGSLASMSLMLALESMGIGTCPLNWPEDKKKDDKVSKLLGLKGYERPIMMIAYGYADEQEKVACSVRKSIDELRKYN